MSQVNSWVTIDCHYQFPQFAAAFLKTKSGKSVLIENNTSHAIPFLLDALIKSGGAPDQVDFLIVTHAHLDHAGATGQLMQLFKNAQLIAHPKAARTLINPERLVESAERVYGQSQFEQLYGQIAPVPAERTIAVQDGDAIQWQGETFQFFFTEGHASHHCCVAIPESGEVFTGDAFGLCYPSISGKAPFHFPSTSPVDFDHAKAAMSIDKILSTQSRGAFLTHFGWVQDLTERGQLLKQHLDFHQELIEKSEVQQVEDEQLESWMLRELQQYFEDQLDRCGVQKSQQVLDILKMDIHLNAAGLTIVARKRRKSR
ncbi:MBL fold metallo-hydrolase [bacterium]|nr:MBL fold metallo-hydrolase [bacterium]